MATAQMSIRMTGLWNRVDAMLDPAKWQRVIRQEMDRSTRVNAQYLRREFRMRIKRRKYKPNAELTNILKNSVRSTPLVDHGDLWASITYKKLTKTAYMAGILRGRSIVRAGKGGSATDIVNLALILHEGQSIKVTRKMRMLFRSLHAYSTGTVDQLHYGQLTGRAIELSSRMRSPGVKPLKATTKYIHIPPRRFLRDPFMDPQVRRNLMLNWRNGMERALRRMSQQ
jgi:hypothetical protein